MPPVGFEPTISAGERPPTYALDREANGTGFDTPYIIVKCKFSVQLQIATQSSSEPLRKNENTLLLNTFNNTLHTLKKRSPKKKEKKLLSINRVKWNIKASQHTTLQNCSTKDSYHNQTLF